MGTYGLTYSITPEGKELLDTLITVTTELSYKLSLNNHWQTEVNLMFLGNVPIKVF